MSGDSHGIWTAANIVTCIRIVFIPLFLVVAALSVAPAGASVSPSRLGVAVFFIVLSFTDKLDGYLARSRGEVTTFGKFLDPIADKLVVVTALLVLLDWDLVPVWIIVVIIAREFLVSGLRMVVASKGVVVAASNLGKWKTATTMGALAGLFVWSALPESQLAGTLLLLSDCVLYAAVALTIWSGVDYFAKCRKFLLEEDD